MSGPPLSRDRQIELMLSAAERIEARAKALIANPIVREIVAAPAPGQQDEVRLSTQTVRLPKRA